MDLKIHLRCRLQEFLKTRSMSDLKGLTGHLPAGWNTFETQFRTGLEVDLS